MLVLLMQVKIVQERMVPVYKHVYTCERGYELRQWEEHHVGCTKGGEGCFAMSYPPGFYAVSGNRLVVLEEKKFDWMGKAPRCFKMERGKGE